MNPQHQVHITITLEGDQYARLLVLAKVAEEDVATYIIHAVAEHVDMVSEIAHEHANGDEELLNIRRGLDSITADADGAELREKYRQAYPGDTLGGDDTYRG